MEKAHRYAYRLFKGKIQKRKIIMHVCDVKACVRPKHLIQGTKSLNSKDAWSRGRTRKVRAEIIRKNNRGRRMRSIRRQQMLRQWKGKS